VLQHLLWKLYHINSAIDQTVESVESASGRIKSLRKDLKTQDKKLEEKRKAQSAAKLEMKKAQTAVTKAEKALEDRVR
jgi:predicted  nucleic acid-binding Zn-ribbon protein